jgi:Ca2+-binding RTX toxin-like protein
MNRLPLLLAALVAATIALPAAAQGATLERYSEINGTLLVTGAPAETNLISVEDRPGLVVIRDDAVPLDVEAGGCERLDERSARCWMAKQVWIDLNDGNDVATIASKRLVSINGGAGNDRYNAVGTDKPSQVDFFGGFGTDIASYGPATDGVVVGVDGMPFDGRPGDNDWIDRTVETVFGSPHDDVLTGSQREQRLFGLDGNDTLAGGPASDELFGGLGQDAVDARDGELDAVDCGGQLFDRVTADPAEASITGCAEVLVG